MNQIFRPSANTYFKVIVLSLALVVASVLWSMAVLDRSNFTRRVNQPLPQPIAFSHELHAGSLGMNCRYCHSSVDVSSFANIPPSETCMTCHHEIRTNSPDVQKIWESYSTGVPVEWNKVYDLPDHVYFNHSIHVSKGVGCTTCHGQVNEMPVVWRVHDLTMGWCLDCHRNPEKYVRPLDQIYSLEWQPPANQIEQGLQLVETYNINYGELDHCNICHR
ncbi:MAG: cytochrome c3 family protein [Chloroflexaceae bacterium]|nr:cytochrome c3 family protein [Chloroflexaceae bacterium]